MKHLFLICFLSVVIANNPMRVNHNRLNDNFINLSKISSIKFGSLSRVAYTDADIIGRQYIMKLMMSAGMDVKIDEGGNIIGRLKGKNNNLPPIAIGSHIDSVPGGGSFDGNVGSLSAIEVAQTIWDNNYTLNHPLVVVIFQNEEGGLFGSKVMTTGLTDLELRFKRSIASSGCFFHDKYC
jgi:beta-ureidopropionase / N-carbamoyl-L-amino-acid hydrolase